MSASSTLSSSRRNCSITLPLPTSMPRPISIRAQVTSGTLSYAVGPRQADRLDALCPCPGVARQPLWPTGRFRRQRGLCAAINALLADREGTEALRRRVYELGRTMIWPRLAEASLERFEAVAARGRSKPLPIRPPAIPRELGLAAIERMCDATGMLQHSHLRRARPGAWLLHRRQCPRADAGLP